jgi:hypothetical protein
MVSFMPRPLYPQGKCLQYPLDKSLGGPQSRSGRDGEDKNSQLPTGSLVMLLNAAKFVLVLSRRWRGNISGEVLAHQHDEHNDRSSAFMSTD